TNAGSLTVGSVSGVNGVTSTGGNIALTVNTADNTLTNTNAISTTGAGTITLTADRMALAGTISTGSGRVILRATTAGRLVNLGSATDVAANTLELSSAELGTVTTTGVLQVGGGTEGALTVSAAVSV